MVIKIANVFKRAAFGIGVCSLVCLPGMAQEKVAEEVLVHAPVSPVRTERPLVWSVDLGFPKGLGISTLYNIQPEWAVGATASHVALWPTLGVFGRYFLEPTQSSNSSFAEWRLYTHPGVASGAYLIAPYVSTHLLYGWETRTSDGYYSHLAFGLGVGNSTNEGLLLGFLNFEVSFGGSIGIKK